VYRIYSEAMDEAGLPKYHFLGHGLGVTLHEEPFIDAIRDIRLEPGMVMCVEPLCLFEGRFGLQIEDEVLVTQDGCEPITNGGPLLKLGD
jgi:Xaa-Pro aminopeptidase